MLKPTRSTPSPRSYGERAGGGAAWLSAGPAPHPDPLPADAGRGSAPSSLAGVCYTSIMIARSLDEALTPITDGCVLAVPREASGVAMAATRALIRRGLRRLHLIALPTSSLQADLLIGAGCVETIETSAVSLGEFGPAPRFTAAVTSGAIRVKDATCPALYAAFQAAEKGVPYHGACGGEDGGDGGAALRGKPVRRSLARGRRARRLLRASDRGGAERRLAARACRPLRRGRGAPRRVCAHGGEQQRICRLSRPARLCPTRRVMLRTLSVTRSCLPASLP